MQLFLKGRPKTCSFFAVVSLLLLNNKFLNSIHKCYLTLKNP